MITGSYECKLCLTLHNNEGSYLAHTQGKKHQANLARRAAKEAKEAPQQLAPEKPRIEPKKFVKIGRPGYRVTKQKDPENGQQSLLFQVDYPGLLYFYILNDLMNFELLQNKKRFCCKYLPIKCNHYRKHQNTCWFLLIILVNILQIFLVALQDTQNIFVNIIFFLLPTGAN